MSSKESPALPGEDCSVTTEGSEEGCATPTRRPRARVALAFTNQILGRKTYDLTRELAAPLGCQIIPLLEVSSSTDLRESVRTNGSTACTIILTDSRTWGDAVLRALPKPHLGEVILITEHVRGTPAQDSTPEGATDRPAILSLGTEDLSSCVLRVLMERALDLVAARDELLRRTRFEHSIGSIAYLLINAPRHELPRRIEESLKLAAGCCEVDHAILLLSSGEQRTPPITYEWHGDGLSGIRESLAESKLNAAHWFRACGDSFTPSVIDNPSSLAQSDRAVKLWCREHQVTMFAVVPLAEHRELKGLLLLMRRSQPATVPEEWDPHHQSLFTIIGELFLSAIQRVTYAEALERNEERLRAYFTSSFIGLATTTPDMKWLDVNETACRLYGYSREELESRTWLDFTHPEDRASDYELHQRLVRGEIPGYSVDKRYFRKDGSMWHARLSVSAARKLDGSCDYIVALIQDITNSKRAEYHLKAQREYLRQVLDTLPDLIYVKDAGGKYVLANQALARWYGTTPDKMIGHHASEFEPNPRSLERFSKEDQEVVEHGRSVHVPEVKVISRISGHTHYFETRKAPLRAPDSDDTQILGISTDITARKASEQQREELHARLLQSQKMEAIGQLAAGVAHDLNNSLAAVVGHLQLIKLDSSLNGDVARSVDVALSGCERASTLIESLLGFSRQGKYNLTSIDCDALIDDTIKFLERIIGSDISLSIERAPSKLFVRGDSGQLQQALTNLVINARQAMPRGGALSIRISNRREAHPERYNARALPGEFVVLALTDTGVGIPHENLERIFEPFFTTKQERQGTGLGLAMVYGILQHHGGWIEVESIPQVGSTFSLLLPREHATSSEALSESEEPQLMKSNSKGTVLIVDDEPHLVELTGKFLELAGFTTVGFSDGREAATWFRDHHGMVDMVVMDMKMPSMSGAELFTELQRVDPNVKTVILSGYMQDSAAQALLDAGALKFFQKPLKFIELTTWITELLQEATASASPGK